MFWMMEFPPLPLETSPNQAPVYSCCCYSAVLYFPYKTTPFISFLTSHTEEIQRMEVSQFSITLRNMRLMRSCGPFKVIVIVFRKWKGPELSHSFLSIHKNNYWKKIAPIFLFNKEGIVRKIENKLIFYYDLIKIGFKFQPKRILEQH